MSHDFLQPKDVKPTLYGYIKEAQLMLQPDLLPEDKIVHDLRVLMKKSRATMKLINQQLDDKVFNREYNAFLEVGHLMQLWRETSVYRKTLKDLRKRNPAAFLQLQDNEMLNSLMKKPEISATSFNEKVKEGVQRIMELLNKTGYRIRFLNMKIHDPVVLLKELELTYKKVTDVYLTARNYPKTNNLHKFRKISKDFLYQLCFFRDIKPKVIKDLEKKLEHMTQNLGRYHDLALLIKALDYRYCKADNNTDLDELILVVRQEQDKCLANVWPKAFKIFCPGNSLVNVLGYNLTMT